MQRAHHHRFRFELFLISLCTIVGNKTDLEEQREVPTEMAEKYAASENALFMEVSWESSHNLSEMFEIVVKELEYVNLDEFSHQGQGLQKAPKSNNGSWWYFY